MRASVILFPVPGGRYIIVRNDEGTMNSAAVKCFRLWLNGKSSSPSHRDGIMWKTQDLAVALLSHSGTHAQSLPQVKASNCRIGLARFSITVT